MRFPITILTTALLAQTVSGGPFPRVDPRALVQRTPVAGFIESTRASAPTPLPVTSLDGSESPAQKVRRQLDRVISVDIADRSFPKAIQELQEKSGIKFVVDRRVIDLHLSDRTGDDFDDTTVSLRLNREPLRPALRQLLAEHGLGLVILGDRVMITTQAMIPRRVLGQVVNVDVTRAPLGDVLRKLARDTVANIILDARAAKEGQEKVTLQLEDVSLEVAVKLLAESAGLRAVVMDSVLYVTTKENAAGLREEPRSPEPRRRRD